MNGAKNSRRGDSIVEVLVVVVVLLVVLWLGYRFIWPLIHPVVDALFGIIGKCLINPIIQLMIGMALALWFIWGAIGALRGLIVGIYKQLHEFYGRLDAMAARQDSVEARMLRIAEEARSRVRPVAAAVILFSQGFLIIADKVLPENKKAVIVAGSLVILIMLTVANECLLRDNLFHRTGGYVLWFGALAILPVASIQSVGIEQTLKMFSGEHAPMAWISLGCMVLLTVLPFLIRWGESMDEKGS